MNTTTSGTEMDTTDMEREMGADAATDFPDVSVRFHTFSPEGAVRARGSMNIGGCFAIRNVKLMLSKEKGYYLGMPAYKVGDDWKDLCFPTTSEFRQHMIDTAVAEYEKLLDKAHQASRQNVGITEPGQQGADPFERPGHEAGYPDSYVAAPQGHEAGMASM